MLLSFARPKRAVYAHERGDPLPAALSEPLPAGLVRGVAYWGERWSGVVLPEGFR
jgi:hypothetical protein